MCLLFLIEWSNRIQSKCDECWKKENASFLSLLFFCVVPGARSLVLRLVLVSPKSHSCIHFCFPSFSFFRILRSYSTKPSFVVLFCFVFLFLYCNSFPPSYFAWNFEKMVTMMMADRLFWVRCSTDFIFFSCLCEYRSVVDFWKVFSLHFLFFFLISAKIGGVWMFKEKGI